MRVVVTASNAIGSTPASSAASATVLPLPPSNTVLPSVSGAAVEGQTLSVNNGTWSGSPTSFSYQWEDCNTSGGGCSSVSGAASASYKLVAGDVGHTLRVVVTASNAGGSGEVTSAATAVVTAPQSAPSNTVLPSVSGSAEEGQTLSASTGTWTESPTSFSYQWEDCNTSGGSCSSISGANASSYKLVASDLGHTLRIVVTASNASGSTPATSTATSTVVSLSPGTQIYVSQAGAGSQSGEGGCGSGHPLSWLNNSGDWGSGGGKVGPGTTVNLCGTLTEAITAHTSGESAKPITLKFQPGAKIEMPACPKGSGCINTNSQNYLHIEGTSETERGLIINTQQGTGKKEGGAAEGVRGIVAEECEGCTIRYLNIENLYVKTSESDQTSAEPIQGIRLSGSDFTLAHVKMNNVGWALYGLWVANNGPVHIEYVTLEHVGHGFTTATAFGSAQTVVGPIVFAHSEVYGGKAWSDTTDDNHQDAIHCFSGTGTTPPHYDGLYIYDDKMGAEGGAYVSAAVYIEGSTGPACGNSTSNVWLFNNVMDLTERVGDGGIVTWSTEPHVYNNTMIGPNTTEAYPCGYVNGAGSSEAREARVMNDLSTTCNEITNVESARLAAGGVDYNLFGNGGDNAFICNDKFEVFKTEGFAHWKACTGQESHSKMEEAKVKCGLGGCSTRTEIERAGELEPGSPAKEGGTNLTSLCVSEPHAAALCENINGEARPKTGAWNIGAY
jgi:hypothetical protein